MRQLSSSFTWQAVVRGSARAFSILCLTLVGSSIAQTTNLPQVLPEHPSVHADQTTGIVTGRVLDSRNQPLPGALIVLSSASDVEMCRTHSSSDGHFSCNDIPLGPLNGMVSASGFVDETLHAIELTAGTPTTDLQLVLKLPATSTSVNVYASTEEIAAAQIHAAEKQRLIGIVPNFYTSFEKNPAPLSTSQKFSLAVRDLADPVSFLGAGVTAGIEQARNDYAGYGQGASGYGKRYAAAYGDRLTSDLFRHAIYTSLFHEDPRYFYQGTGSVKSRFIHAISFAFVLRGDDGSTKPNYAYLAGYLTSGAISNAYYPHADRGAGLVFTRAGVGVAGAALDGLFREFIFSHFTTHRPSQP